MTLLEETLQELKENNKTELDILWCGCEGTYFNWEYFKEIANIEYDNGYGGAEIHLSLIIVGKNFWLERAEYGGSEWWDFKTYPKKPKTCQQPETLLS